MRIHNKKARPKLQPIVITTRDRDLFAALANYRVLTTEQICALFYPSVHRARKRLYQLWQHGLLTRAARPTQLGEGSSQLLHALSVKGQRLLPNNEMPLQLPRVNPKSFSEHSERINSVRICLTLAARGADDLSVTAWSQGTKLKMLVAGGYPLLATPITIIPDAMFTLTSRGRDYVFFLEVDQGRTDLKRITEKCAGYHWLWQQKEPQRRFGIRSFRVLYLTTSPTRLEHIMTKLQQLRHNSTCPDLIAGATVDAVSLVEPQELFSSVWQSVADTGAIVVGCPLPSLFIDRSRPRLEHHSCASRNPDASFREPPGSVAEGSPRLPSLGSGPIIRHH